jgi:hypothetical protein
MDAVRADESAQRLDGHARTLLWAFVVFTFLAFMSAYVQAERTDESFAWTIDPPVTAAFLGAGYGAGLAAALLSLWRGEWEPTLLGLRATFVFVTVMLAATLIHLDRFHLDAEGLALVAGWMWLVIYLIVPPWALWVLVRSRGRDSAGRIGESLPTAAVVVLLVQGVVIGGVSLALLFAPATAEWLWPWELTPLTARATAVWLSGLAVAALLAVRVSTPAVLEIPAGIYLTIAVLQAGAALRFRDQVAWADPAGIFLIVLLVVMAATGAAGFVLARRVRVAADTQI